MLISGLFSAATSRNDMLSSMSPLTVSRMWNRLKSFVAIHPRSRPTLAPVVSETRISTIGLESVVMPAAIPVKLVNSTITKMSSIDEPAMIICGMLLAVPIRRSMRLIIRGTMTAGDTAAMTEPRIAASSRVMPKIKGAMITTPAISNSAGRKLSSIAGRPTCLSSLALSARPARSSITTSASCRSSCEMPSSAGSSRSSICGPSSMPVSSIPISAGSLSRENSLPAIRLHRVRSAMDVSMLFR